MFYSIFVFTNSQSYFLLVLDLFIAHPAVAPVGQKTSDASFLSSTYLLRLPNHESVD
ncbi:hypothetical protein ACQKMD_12920 [Viridibacillus sp. NPDC096237]|uniref:hypothetical protein n=1 Tax=Viridibacillus sp. NPDC096237 TaxID=3390721 RepID=UPI003CFD811A